MKVEVKESKPPKVTVGSLKPGDVFTYGNSSHNKKYVMGELHFICLSSGYEFAVANFAHQHVYKCDAEVTVSIAS